jgi:hypothetical protein
MPAAMVPEADRAMGLASVRLAVVPSATPPEANVSVPVPRAESLPATMLPAERVVPPEWEFEPESVRLPVPAFVRPPLPEKAPE